MSLVFVRADFSDFLADLDLLSTVPGMNLCHWISQKLSFEVSFSSPAKLRLSSLGEPTMPLMTEAGPWLYCEPGPPDCHLSASVEIGAGLTGLFSRILSTSIITAMVRRGRSCSA